MKDSKLVAVMLGFMLLSLPLYAKIIPSDGQWQTYDDPVIGSGINIRTQGGNPIEASERQQNSSDPLTIVTPEGWWLMAQENAPSSLLLHLVKQSNKLIPPIPTDRVFFENQVTSSDFIRGVECPTDYAYQWAYCGVLLAEGHGSDGWGLSMNNMGSPHGRYFLKITMRQTRINPPFQP